MTRTFLSHFGLDTLRDLPDIEALEDAGLLDAARLRAGGFPLPADSDGDAPAYDDEGDKEREDNL